MNQEIVYWSITGLVFLSVALFAFGTIAVVSGRGKVRQRFASVNTGFAGQGEPVVTVGSVIQSAVHRERVGPDDRTKRKLRAELIRAGFFSPYAAEVYTTTRLAVAVVLPFILYFVVTGYFSDIEPVFKFVILAVGFLFSYYLPQAYLDRRTRLMQERYRCNFPDFLDLLVVCVDAGLSLEAALERVAEELGMKDPQLRANLGLMSGEMRAGRGTIEALRNFAERLGLAEARSLAVLLHQSLELGTDVAQALSTYSEEMRDKRMSRAEQKAYALPVKLTLPLGLFMFPVLMIVIMTPVLIRIIKAFGGF